jgi:TonB family protein
MHRQWDFLLLATLTAAATTPALGQDAAPATSGASTAIQSAAEILVGFELDETGRVLSSNVVQGSGDASFDEAALAMIRRSDPVPKPPAAVVAEGLTFTLPVIFRAGHGR